MMRSISAQASVVLTSFLALGCGNSLSGGFGGGGETSGFSRNSDGTAGDVDAGTNGNGQNGNGTAIGANGTGANGAGANGSGVAGGMNGNGVGDGSGGGNNGLNGGGTLGSNGGSADCKWLSSSYAETVSVPTDDGEVTALVNFMQHDPYRYGDNVMKAAVYLLMLNNGEWVHDDGVSEGKRQLNAQLTLNDAGSANCSLAVSDVSAEERNNGGCFHPKTKIRLANGRDIPIAFLKPSDKVWNPVTKQALAIKRMVAGPEKPGFFLIATEKGQVKVTEKHPFETRQGLRTADQLSLDSYVLGSDGRFHRIETIKQLAPEPGAYAWNLELETISDSSAQHMVLADGVVTGDLFLQESLADRQQRALVFGNERLKLDLSPMIAAAF